MLSRQAEGREWSGGDRSGVEGTGVEGRGGEGRAGQGRAGQGRAGQGRAGQGRAGQGRVPDCLGGLSRVGISSRSHATRPWNGQPHSKILKRSIRVAKQLFLESTFNRYKFDIRNTWKTINEILSGNHKTTCFPNSLNINGNEITNQLHIATEFNVFFTNIGLNLSNHIAYSGEKDCEYYLKDNINCKFALNKVDEQYVSKIIDNLPNKASCGFDNISTLCLKQISPTIITPLTLLINQVFNTGIFPERLK